VQQGGSAIGVFEKAVGKDVAGPKAWALSKKGEPHFAALCSQVCVAYQLAGKLGPARDLIQAAVDAQPAQVSYRLQLGDLQWQMQNYKSAIEAFEGVLERDDRNAAAWHGLGRCYQDTNRSERAMNAYGRAVQLHPNNVVYLRDLGKLSHFMGDKDRALQLLQRAAQIEPDNTSIPCEIGWVHLKSRDYSEALTVFRREVQKAHTQPSCWFGLGTALAQTGKLEEAVSALREACRRDPEAAGCWRDLGNVLYELRRYGEAAETYRKALLIQEDNPVLWVALGACLEASSLFVEALSAYRTASSLDSMGDAWGDQMHVYNRMGRFDEALALGQKTLGLGVYNPKKPENLGLTNPRYVYRMMAEAYIGQKKYAEALEECEKAEKASKAAGDGTYHRCFVERGDAWRGLGETKKARQAYEKALRGPEPEVARQRLDALGAGSPTGRAEP
jgi:tetratricopeptide (TPR) repeat protein